MRKRVISLFCSAVIVLSLVGCHSKYHADDFIGKTSAQIISEFGSFDCSTMSVSSDGIYKNCRCGYTIKEAQKGFLGTSTEVLFFITFDENGIAISCEEGYRPGG